MSMIGVLLKRHSKKLSEEQRDLIANLDRKNAATSAYAWPKQQPEDHNFFIRLDRVFSSDPVDLFGQTAPSMAYNKISVQRPNENGEPGEVVLSALMSEQAITNMMLLSNTGSSGIPATAHTLSGQELPRYSSEEHMHDIAHWQSEASVLSKLSDVANDALEASEKATSIVKRRKALEALGALKGFTSRAGEMDFYMKSRGESYGKKRVDFVSEAANAALHAARITDFDRLLEEGGRIRERIEQFAEGNAPEFDPEVDRNDNVMLNAILGRWSEDETRAMAELVQLEIEHIKDVFDFDLAEHINENGQLDAFRDMRFPSDEAKQAANSIKNLINSAMNKYVLEGRRQQTHHGLGVSVTRTQMAHEYMHSSLPATGGNLFSLSFHSAYEVVELGRCKMSGAHSPILDVQLGADDFMMLLRGHPTGAATPCTLHSMAGSVKTPPDRQPHEIEVGLAGIRKGVVESGPAGDIKDLISDLEKMITSNTKPAEFAKQVKELREACAAYHSEIRNGFAEGENLLRASVSEVVRADIAQMQSELPDGFLDKIMMIEGEEGQDAPDLSP